jgi:hypothetical protein
MAFLRCGFGTALVVVSASHAAAFLAGGNGNRSSMNASVSLDFGIIFIILNLFVFAICVLTTVMLHRIPCRYCDRGTTIHQSFHEILVRGDVRWWWSTHRWAA